MLSFVQAVCVGGAVYGVMEKADIVPHIMQCVVLCFFFFFSFEGVVLFVLAKPHSLQNLSSLTKDQTDASCHGSLES